MAELKTKGRARVARYVFPMPVARLIAEYAEYIIYPAIAAAVPMNWAYLSLNPAAMPMLLANWDKIDWDRLSENPAAMPQLLAHPKLVNRVRFHANPAAMSMLPTDPRRRAWWWLSGNPAAIELLRANLGEVFWPWLCSNPAAMSLILAHPEKIDWEWLSANPAAIGLLIVDGVVDSRCSIKHLNMNPAAIEVLRANPEWLSETIYSNPAIFIPNPAVAAAMAELARPQKKKQFGRRGAA